LLQPHRKRWLGMLKIRLTVRRKTLPRKKRSSKKQFKLKKGK